MADPTTLGNRLRARRVDLGLTLAEVATRAGLSLPYVSNLERGRGNPTMEAITALAKALETSVAALVDDPNADPVVAFLAQAPASLHRFLRSERFHAAVVRLARDLGEDPDTMRRRLAVSMAAAPRRSSGQPTDVDWRRLLDAYFLIASDEA